MTTPVERLESSAMLFITGEKSGTQASRRKIDQGGQRKETGKRL